MIAMPKEQFLALRRQVIEKDFSRMNDMQKQAVFCTEGPLLILAGAGSGKTTVVVNRIAQILRYGKAWDSSFVPEEVTDADVAACEAYLRGEAELDDEVRSHLSVSACPPWRVMAITFTNKAAGELKDRLCNMLGEAGNDIWASTFHSSCARILRRHGERLGYSRHFTIYDSDDTKRLMKSVLKEMAVSEKIMAPRTALNEISHAKDSLVSPEEYARRSGGDFRLQMIAKAYIEYQKHLKANDAMDFDDLIVNTVKLFAECPDVLEEYADKFRYLMVDEYQDTNHAQYVLIKQLASKHGNLCVVGDDDQSIYKFRGATIENIMNFEETFPNAQVIRLEQNYRSTQNILDAANAVISNNMGRKGKTLWTSNGAGAKLHLISVENEQEEAQKIADKILEGVAKGRRFSDYAVLYRMNSQSLALERTFAKSGIPHRIIGGTRFYERREIRDMLAYLSVINNPEDEIRLRRIINVPKRGIGDRSVDNAAQIGAQIGESVYSVLCHAWDFPALSRSSAKLLDFAGVMKKLVTFAEDESHSIADLYQEILDTTDYLMYLRSEDPDAAEDRIANVNELLSNIRRYEEENEEPTLSEFLEEIALLTDIDNYDADSDAAVMMTVHSAKGLEFPVVFLPGMEENIFPGMQSTYNPEEVEEERRLAYVAITRAKEELFVLHSESRMLFGMTQRNRISRFVTEIPEELIQRESSRELLRHALAQQMAARAAQQNPGAAGTGKAAHRRPSVDVATAGGFSAAAKPAASVRQHFKVGDTVTHRAFGTGLVVSATPMANDTLLEVSFDKVGTKKLFANFAKLKKQES